MFLEESRDRILERFEELCRELPGIMEEIRQRLGEYTGEEALALKYLYGAMPYSDIGNYPLDTYLDYARQGVYLWENSPFVKEMPEDVFLNYVLYHRVNEEEIKPCRRLFWDKMKGRISGKDMREAVLEVNYWCAQEVTYRCTDDRTISALDAYLCGYGRCGEESAFAVQAFRSAGIPARQVYAPKWSHCDDNHAWAEVWCDGQWHFAGACEPKAILDSGWFTNAASRAMMVHSRWFDTPEPKEAVIGKEGMVTMVNQLARYAAVKKITLRVVNLDGFGVAGAKVSAQVLNYSEFAPVAEMLTGEDGSVSLVTGLGSLGIHASFGDEFGEALMDTRGEDVCTVTLGEEPPEEVWTEFDMIAPADSPVNTAQPSKAQKEENERRTALAAGLRNEKTKSFRPRWKDEFLSGDSGLQEKYMAVLSAKDRVDADPEVLAEHYEASREFGKAFDEELFLTCVWNPRIADEVLTKWRGTVKKYFTREQQEAFRERPADIWEWIEEHIISRDGRERLSIDTAPGAVLKLGAAGMRSKTILFVAIARTLGIPARLNPVDCSMEYWRDGKFRCVLEGAEKNAHLRLLDKTGMDWVYFQNWSIARCEKGQYVSLRLGGRSWEDGTLALDVEPGSYRILTSNRLPNGNIFADCYDFDIEEEQEKTVVMEFRDARLTDMLESNAILPFCLMDGKGETVPVGEITAGGRRILFWLEESKEPTEHILNELMERKEEFREYQEDLVFIVRNEAALKDSTLSKCREALPKVQVCYDTFKENAEILARRMYLEPGKFPLVVVTEGKLNGIYATCGYNVGNADMLLRILKM